MSAATPPRAEEDGLPHPARAKGFNLSAWAITHQPLTRFFLVVLLLAGLFSYFRLGQNEDPEFTFRAMAIRTLWPGASAHEVEQQVTDRLEKKLQETPHLDFTRSYSRPGESVVFVMLRQDTRGRDVADVWYQVRKKIGDIRAGLPADVIGPFFNDEFGDTFGSIYALSGEAFSYAELKEYAEAVRQRLLRVPDVAKVELYGVQDEKIYVELSRAKLAGLGLDLQQVATLIQAQNAMLPAGTVITASETVSLRVAGEADSVATLAALPLRANGVSFRLGDVATLSRGYQDPPITLMRHQGRPVIGLGVAMRKGGDIIELGENLGRAVGDDTQPASGAGHRPGVRPAAGGGQRGGRVCAHAGRSGDHCAHRQLPQPGLALGAGGGAVHPPGAGHHFPGHALVGHRPAEDLAGRPHHRPRPAGGRRHDRRRDDGAQTGGGAGPGGGRHLRL